MEKISRKQQTRNLLAKQHIENLCSIEPIDEFEKRWMLGWFSRMSIKDLEGLVSRYEEFKLQSELSDLVRRRIFK